MRDLSSLLDPSADASSRVDIHAVQNEDSQWQQYLAQNLRMSKVYVLDAAVSAESISMETQQLEQAALAEASDEQPVYPIQLYVLDNGQDYTEIHRVLNKAHGDPDHTVIVLLAPQATDSEVKGDAAQLLSVHDQLANSGAKVYTTIEDATEYLNSLV